MVELKFAVNNLDIPGMDYEKKDNFFKNKKDFRTKVQNVECNFLDPIIYSKAWDFEFVKNPIGTCFNQRILSFLNTFPGRVVNLEFCQKCQKLYWGCLKGHKSVHWEKVGYGNLYCESCRCTYSKSQIELYHNKKEKEFEIEEKKKSQEYDEYLRKTTFIQVS